MITVEDYGIKMTWDVRSEVLRHKPEMQWKVLSELLLTLFVDTDFGLLLEQLPKIVL